MLNNITNSVVKLEMLAKLKQGILSTSEAEKMMYRAKVDKSHDLIANRHLV